MARFFLPALFLGFTLLSAQTADPRWEPLRFLIGKWKGSGAGDPGAGQGAFSFSPELNGHILVRRSFNQLASGTRHEDLMIVYAGEEGKAPHAIYFDNEGHTILYEVAFPAASTAVFTATGSPGYRLTYNLDKGTLNGRFEVGGKTYLTWTSVRE